MGKIVYLMGKSSSGKDTIYRQLLQDDSLHLKKIVPYTTRPQRAGEAEGVEYYFTDEAGFQKMKPWKNHRGQGVPYLLWNMAVFYGG